MLGERQWAWFDAELEEIARRGARQVVVISSVPVVHMGGEVEHLIPRAAEMHDDVLDHWSSRPNRSDQSRLLGKLFQLRKTTGANVLILGGDVHVGTVASIVSDDRRFVLDDEDQAQIHQGVSSAIAHEAPAGISANVVRWLSQREHPLRGAFVGRVARSKGVYDAAEAWRLAKLDVPLVFAGTGPERGRLEELGFEVTGWLDRAALSALYQRARAVVMPSRWQEPYGIVGLEALAAGVPVAAWDSGGVREWHPGPLPAWGDVDGLARAVRDAVSGARARPPERPGRAELVTELERVYAAASSRRG